MKIDLHLHSPASENNGDAIKWENTFTTIKTLHSNGIKLAAFSDHNTFDYEFYKEVRKLGKTGGMVFLPAIEANVVRKNGVIANLIYVFREDLTDAQLKKISSIARKELPKRGISIESANALFSEFETLRIPHIGKSDHFKYDDLLDLKYDAFEVTNMKHPNYVSILKKGLISSTVSFSDTHVWTNYPQQGFLITEMNLEKPCFDELKEFLELHRVYSKERA
ncbi:PHP domain-containing protein [Mycoplasma todarodis]|uniref:PHP domain-containing protein n=1 Tax=Mycoplasma todarodis TaxID=1937191 RepID=UPI003B3771CA